MEALTSFPFCSSFDADLEDWSTEIVSGSADWTSAGSTGNNISAFSGGAGAWPDSARAEDR